MLQSLGVPYVGSQLPLVQGVSFAAVGTMTAAATDTSIGDPHARLAVIFGAVIVAGVFGFIIAPLFAQLVRYFPPVVTGCVITIIGLSLFPVALRWIRGNAMIRVNGELVENPNYAAGWALALGAVTLFVTLAVARFGKGLFARMAVMVGLVVGTVIATIMGKVNWGAVGTGPVFQLPQPFFFGAPQFRIGVIISMCIVILVIMAETTADLLAVGEILGTDVDRKRIADGLRADMGATAIAPIFNGFPISAFAQNVGMVAMTGIKSRFVVAAGGVILVVLGLLPVLGRVMNAIPQPVLGGAGIVLFGSVAASGIRTLSRVNVHQLQRADRGHVDRRRDHPDHRAGDLPAHARLAAQDLRVRDQRLRDLRRGAEPAVQPPGQRQGAAGRRRQGRRGQRGGTRALRSHGRRPPPQLGGGRQARAAAAMRASRSSSSSSTSPAPQIWSRVRVVSGRSTPASRSRSIAA